MTESNARMVQWDDGSFSLVLGDEVYDCAVDEMVDERTQLLAINANKDVEVLDYIPYSSYVD